MIDKRLKTRNERYYEHREGFCAVHFSFLILALIIFTSCTDYVQKINDQEADFIAEQIAESESSAANKIRSSSSVEKRSSSSKNTVSVSSAKSSSSSFVQQKSSASKTQKLSSSSKNISSSSAKKIMSSSSAKSSSSIKSCSSSPDIPDTITIVVEGENEKSSSSSTKSSSGSTKGDSSSSSQKNDVSFSSESVNLSSSSKASWAYLNPAISYGEIIDDRDGQVYKTVVIGEQTWMAENLNYKVQDSYCYDCDMYGRLYSWSVAMDSAGIFSDNGKGCSSTIVEKNCVSSYPVRGICPQKWHLPDSSEWRTLIEATSKGDLKTRSGWYKEKNGSDTYGFSGYPVGYWYAATNTYGNKSNYARFWSSSENTSVNNRCNAYYMYLSYNVTTTFLESNQKIDGFSVRCIKDSPNKVQNTSSSATADDSVIKVIVEE